MVRVLKDETSVKFLYLRSVGIWVDPFPNKRSKQAVNLSWVKNSQRVGDSKKRGSTSEIGTKHLLTCAVEISMKKRITFFNS